MSALRTSLSNGCANALRMSLSNGCANASSDFVSVASLCTDNATVLPPESAMVKGRAAIRVMWEHMAEQVIDPRVTTLEVKSLGPRAAYKKRGNFSLKTKDPTPKEVTGKYARDLLMRQRTQVI